MNPGKAMQIFGQTLVSDETLENLVMEILCNTRKCGMELTPAVIDVEFAGNLGELYEVVLFALDANFENFWKALGIGKKEDQTNLEPQDHHLKVFRKR